MEMMQRSNVKCTRNVLKNAKKAQDYFIVFIQLFLRQTIK